MAAGPLWYACELAIIACGRLCAGLHCEWSSEDVFACLGRAGATCLVVDAPVLLKLFGEGATKPGVHDSLSLWHVACPQSPTSTLHTCTFD